jgi:hypothetical protein
LWRSWQFWEIYHFHPQGQSHTRYQLKLAHLAHLLCLVSCLACSFTLKIEAVCSSELSGSQRMTWCYNPEDCQHISKWWSIWSSVFWGVITHRVSSSGMWRCAAWQISWHFRGKESRLWEPQTQHDTMQFGRQVAVLLFSGPLSPSSLLTSPGSCPLFPTSCLTIFHMVYSYT